MSVFTPTQGLLLGLSGVVGGLFLVALAFSAYAIVLRAGHARRERLWIALSKRWEEPVLTAIVDPGALESVWATVPKEYGLHFVHFVLEYTRRVRGEERGTLRRLAAPYLDELADRTKHRDAGVRMRAVQTLGTLGLPEHAASVIAALDDTSPVVSMVAARYLARAEHSEFAPDVLNHIERFDGWSPRYLASMLAAIGSEVSPQLRTRLGDPEQAPWLRAVHAEALQMQRDPVAGDIAVEVLRSESDRELRAAVLRLLAEVGRPEHLPAIREVCESDDRMLRGQALRALGSVTDGADLPTLVEAMQDDSPWAALSAARGVREAGGASLLENLTEVDDGRARLAGQVLYEEGTE